MELFGVVKQVYLPKEIKNGIELDDLEKSKIGFVVEINGKLTKLEVKQDKSNCKIYKGDRVKIVIEGKKVSIEVNND